MTDEQIDQKNGCCCCCCCGSCDCCDAEPEDVATFLRDVADSLEDAFGE